MSSGIDLDFSVEADGSTKPMTIPVEQVVIAGWTGRDPVARDKHIAELEAIGIARPASTPIFYRVSARRLTLRGIFSFLASEVSQSLLSFGSIEIGAVSTPLTANRKNECHGFFGIVVGSRA